MRYSSLDPFVSACAGTETLVREFRYYPSSMSWLTKCQDMDSLRKYVTQVIDRHYGFDFEDVYAFKVETVDEGMASGVLTIQVKMPKWRYEEYNRTHGKSQG